MSAEETEMVERTLDVQYSLGHLSDNENSHVVQMVVVGLVSQEEARRLAAALTEVVRTRCFRCEVPHDIDGVLGERMKAH